MNTTRSINSINTINGIYTLDEDYISEINKKEKLTVSDYLFTIAVFCAFIALFICLL